MTANPTDTDLDIDADFDTDFDTDAADEYVLSQDDVIITRTDLTGRIVYANTTFLTTSGYRMDEAIGAPQRIVRHPDMPSEAFADMWRTIGRGQPWAGVIKNRRKDGRFYWVAANVTPIFENGKRAGYMSVRTKPSPEQVADAEDLYDRLGDGRVRLSGGQVIRDGVRGLADRALRLPVMLRLWIVMATLAATILLQTVGAQRALLPGVSPAAQAWLLGGAGMLLALVAALYLTREVLAPLKALNASAVQVACGDLRQQFPSAGDAQIRVLAGMLNQMNARLVGILVDAQVSINVIREATRGLAAGNADLAGRTDEQSSAIEQTTASLASITETAERNTRDCERADAEARRTAASAEAAASQVQETVRAMDDVRDHSRRIGDITSVIDAIASQTNIIALNASVEAARAGEYGRGFAVVASEVRSLAQKVAGAAREIKSLIESELDSVTLATQATHRSGETMTAIQEAVTQLADTVRDIARESRGQSAQIAEANIAVGHVSELTQHNAQLVDRVAAASVSLQEQAQWLEMAVSVSGSRTAGAGGQVVGDERWQAAPVAREPSLPGRLREAARAA